jgi:hypothetical protein
MIGPSERASSARIGVFRINKVEKVTFTAIKMPPMQII